MSLFGRFFDFIRYPSHSRTMGILAFLVLLLAIPLTVNIAQKQQELRQRAAFEGSGTNSCDPNDPCTGWTYTACRTADFELGYHPSCGSHNVPSECYPGTAPDTSHCTQATAPGPAQLPNTSTSTGSRNSNLSECQQHGYACNGNTCYSYGDGRSLPYSCASASNPNTGTDNGSTSNASNLTCLNPSGSIPPNCHYLGTGSCTGGNAAYDCTTNTNNATAPSLAPQPGVSCDSLNGQCLPPDVGFGDGLTRFYDGNCDNSSYACFAKYNSSGNTTIGPGGTLTINNQCTQGAAGGHYEYTCGANAGCPSGQHKAAYVCPNVGTWSDTTCYLDSLFPAGQNPCGTGTTGGGIGADCANGAGYCVASPPQPACQIIPGNTECLGAQQCAKKGSCAGNSGLTTPVPTAAPVPGGSTASCPATQTGQCLAPTNSCSTEGSQTITTFSGSSCTPVTTNRPCTPTNTNNCNPGNQCPAGGTGTCVAKPATTPPANATTLAFTIGLDGFGTSGDRKAPDKATGITPKRSRNFFYQVFDKEGAGATELDSGQNQLSFSGGKFTASFKLNKNLPAGTYVMKIRPLGYLSKIIRNVVSTGTNATTTEIATLATGDINGDNHITVSADYNALKDCIFKAASGDCQAADLDDSGTVDQFDYNLFLREIAVIQDGE